MKGSAVSKVVSKVQNNYNLARVVQINGRRLSVNECGRVPYHTFSTARRNSTGSFYTALSNFNAPKNTAPMPAMEVIPASWLPREVVWLLGVPGSGKGTNSTHVAKSCGIQAPTIVVSSLLENPECKRIKDAGGMVGDEVVFKALMEELAKPQYRDGAVVDGFPRTKAQAEWISSMHGTLSESGLPPPKFTFVMLSLDEQTSIARQLSRGHTIQNLNSMREVGGLEPLEVRTTDVCEEAARTRFRVFAEQVDAVTQLSSHFRLVSVDADAAIETVRSRLSSALKPSPLPSRLRFPPKAEKPSPLFATIYEGLAFA